MKGEKRRKGDMTIKPWEEKQKIEKKAQQEQAHEYQENLDRAN